MNANLWLSRLRHLLHRGPGPGAWRALCELFEALPAEHTAIALEYAEQHLRAWPIALRRAKLASRPTSAPRWWPLVRSAFLHRADGPLAPLFWGGLLDSIEALDFKGLRGCVFTLSSLDWPGSPRALSLAWNALSDRGVERLLDVPWLGRLEHLNLQRNSITARSVARLADSEALAGLTWLDLSQNAVATPGVEALAASPHLTGLQALSLASNHTPLHTHTAAMEALCAESAATRGLRALDVSNNLLDPVGVGLIAQLPHLTHLDLHGAGLSDDGLAGLLTSAAPLLWLNMATGHSDRARVSSRGLLALAQSPHAARLRSLNLSGCEVDLGALEALADNTPELRVLVLRQVALGDEGAAALARASKLGRLEVLDLEGAGVGPRGLEALARAEGLGGLRRLNLGANPELGERELLSVVQSEVGARLRCLGFPNAYLRGVVQARLGESFPELGVEWGPPSQYSLLTRRRFEGEEAYDPVWRP